jgi:hypothetical protein
LGEDIPGDLIRSLDIPDLTKEVMLSGSALEWLNMDKSAFL